jgi:hypothetical protein
MFAMEWRAHALQQFWTVPDAPKLTQDYHDKTPAKHISVCQAGKDYRGAWRPPSPPKLTVGLQIFHFNDDELANLPL